MFDRITAEQEKMGGVACIRGFRIPVSTIIGLIADGMTTQKILIVYPDLEAEDIIQAIRFAAFVTKERELSINAIT